MTTPSEIRIGKGYNYVIGQVSRYDLSKDIVFDRKTLEKVSLVFYSYGIENFREYLTILDLLSETFNEKQLFYHITIEDEKINLDSFRLVKK